MRWASCLLIAAGLLLRTPALHADEAGAADALPRRFSITAALASPLRIGAPPTGGRDWHGTVGIDVGAVYRYSRWLGAGIRLYDLMASSHSAAATPLYASGGLGAGLLVESALYRIPEWFDLSVEAGVDFDFRQTHFQSHLPGHPNVGDRHAAIGAHGGVHVEYTVGPMLAVGLGLRYQWFPSSSANDAGGHYEDSLSALWPMASITIPAR